MNTEKKAALTERYIVAVTKSLSPPMQDDVRAELEASIADAVEARVEQGEERASAERAALTELGDPAVLAAGYAERPLHLIGPRFYLTWSRLLKLLLCIVPACVVGGTALGQALDNAPIGTLIGQSVVAGIWAVVHVGFWLTVVFAALERTGADALTSWDVEKLPEPQSTGTSRADLIASLVLLGLFAGAILWDKFRGFVVVDGEALPILSPEQWPWATLTLFALIALEAALAFVVYARGHWTTWLAVANSALAVVSLGWVLTLLGRGKLLNPEFVEFVLRQDDFNEDTLGTLAIILVFGSIGIAVWDIVDGWLKKQRDARKGATS